MTNKNPRSKLRRMHPERDLLVTSMTGFDNTMYYRKSATLQRRAVNVAKVAIWKNLTYSILPAKKFIHRRLAKD